jgi:ABC-type multidrug transport system fused ATPase/permease subunit
LQSENSGQKFSVRILLWQVLVPKERRELVGVFFLILIGTFLETLSLGMMIPVLTLLTTSSKTISTPFFTIDLDANKTELIQIAVVGLLGVYLLKNLFLVFSTWFQRGFLTRATARIASRILEIYIGQPYGYHLTKNSSTLIRNTQDASMVVASGVEPALVIVSESLIALSLFLILLFVEPLGTIAVVGSLLLSTFVFQKVSDKKLQRWGSERQIEKSSIIKTIQQGLGAVKDIHVLGRQEWFVRDHMRHQVRDGELLRRINTLQAIPRLWLEVMAIAGLAGLVLIMLATGDDVSSIIPTVGLFAATAFRVLPSITKLVNSRQILKISRSTLLTIHHDLGLSVEKPKSVSSQSFNFDRLEANKVTFAYEEPNSDVLIDVTIAISRGEAVGFVGQSGSGKSTLIDIMLGLLEPQSGSVLINAQTIENVKQSWQKQIGYIPQTIFLMDDSLRRNIAIGIADAEIDEYAIIEALKSAQLEDFVASLPEGLDTVVGERGVRLSGGQRQRIGIARALYHRPSVLVLDEATSSLDTETEHGVMQAVQALQGDKTVIIVAHRLSTVEYCDRLYRLDAGRIVDEGTFDEVMNRSQS